MNTIYIIWNRCYSFSVSKGIIYLQLSRILAEEKKRVFTLLRVDVVVVVVSLADYFFLCYIVKFQMHMYVYNGKNMKCAKKMFKRKMKSLRTARSMVYRWWDANVRNVVTVQMTINVNFESFTLLNWAGCWFVHKQLINLRYRHDRSI